MAFRSFISILIATTVVGCDDSANAPESLPTGVDGPVYVEPGQDLQRALDEAATASRDRRLILRSGLYQSAEPAFCLLALTARHDGIIVEGEDGTVLSARSPENPDEASVSHVIYCGDGLTSRTIVRHLQITGAKGLATDAGVPREDYGLRAGRLQKGLFFFMDGGAAKIYGQSSPRFEDVDFVDNETKLCGGAVSVEQQGFSEHPVEFVNCRFVRNRCPGTGAAVDLLEGSSAEITNCLFLQNIANYGMDEIAAKYGLSYNAEHGCGAITVFPDSRVSVSMCTFTRNWNGVDDRGTGSVIQDSIFADNTASDGSRPGAPYEIDIVHGDGVRNCFFFSDRPDLRGTVSAERNTLDAVDPEFDENHVPQNPAYQNIGYRP